MAWIFLIVGGVFEAIFSFSLGKISLTSGKEMVLWIVSFVVAVSLSMYFLYKAIDTGLGVGVSYAVWAAIGAAGSVLMGIIFLNEPVSFWRVFFLSLLIISVIGLNVSTKAA
ncbi:MAG: QacE family quaternary ammonium compound efflux SMR transporter [Porphyromonadaceae bacterium]|nr:QacE family quaternary ammonium compound efflux SMR transporter [Porphyromonadaceae bacterium]